MKLVGQVNEPGTTDPMRCPSCQRGEVQFEASDVFVQLVIDADTGKLSHALAANTLDGARLACTSCQWTTDVEL